MKDVNFADLFKPNPYNINPDDLKLNDVIITNGLGLMELVEKCEEVQDKHLISSMHGQPLFKMKKLFGHDDNLWILYSSSFTDKMEYVKMATDDDIIKEIVERTCEYDIGNGASVTLTNYSNKDGFSIYKKDEGSVHLSTEEALNLRETLNRFLD